MKKLLLCLFAGVGFLLSSTFLYAQVVVTNSVIDEITKTYTFLFDALRRGDLRTIKLYLSADEYVRYKVLFEQNKEYSAFLRNFYTGANLRVGQVDSVLSATDDVIAEFLVDFPGSETLNTRMRLNRDTAGSWKIKKILRDQKDQGEPDGEDHH
jgi:hypothetical protein